MCPKGDDPLTINQQPKEILFGFDSMTGHLGGVIAFSFNGETVFLEADAARLTEER